VLPHCATRSGTLAACEHSMRRLGTDVIDLYLLHWRGPVPLRETIDAFAALVAAGRIRRWGVSNFDVPDMRELVALPGGAAVQTDQVLYNLAHRGVEWDLLPWCASRGLPIMAYSPFERGRILAQPAVAGIARELGVTPPQLALAWVLRTDGVNAIPRASTPERADENRAAVELELPDPVLAALDRLFPPPSGPVPLDVL
jgi:diketogulonate reductase-like aldo/keto reductase